MHSHYLNDLVNIWHQYRSLAFVAIAFCFICLHQLRARFLRRGASSTSSSRGISLLENEKQLDLKPQTAPPSILVEAPVSSTLSINSQELNHDSKRPRLGPKRITGVKIVKEAKVKQGRQCQIQPIIFYFSLTEGFTKKYAINELNDILKSRPSIEGFVLAPKVYDLAVIDFEDFFEHSPEQDAGTNIQPFYLLLVPTYNIDTLLDNFLDLLKETHNDFRIDTAPLSDIAGYSVFGFGDREGWPTEAEGFCSQAIEVDKWMAKLTARKRAYPLGLGDVRSDILPRFDEWRDGILKALDDLATYGNLGEGAPGSGEALESDEEDSVESTLLNAKSKSKRQQSGMGDLEDMGGKSRPSPSLAIDFTTTNQQVPKAMVPTTSPTYTALTKQGYTIIGSHSGVKICRWTKSALRGRGSCYKYSFYGIQSHLCMETTPSLSCSNKCVFCWRHGTNPVGTTWRWQVDPPEMIFDGAKQGHYKKIKMMRGVPGVRAERFQEAMKIRHCALSLVGEPIFYPHINEFVALLHREHISSFLVCNAQHPDQLAALQPVTQLYVSIDASNAESLRKIDRPLHRDYWQRFQRCLDIIREKRFRMRTVFRLTLVKGFNIDEEVEGYADLVARGLPCFVEIKGVTYCGTSTSASAGLSMQNVPFYHEIQTFVEALNEALERRGLEYGIAAEHAHSCCALIASRRFFVEGKWHTLIGYEKFFACLESGKEFSPEDYMGEPTPEWATWGKGGFDPRDERVDRKGRVIETDS